MLVGNRYAGDGDREENDEFLCVACNQVECECPGREQLNEVIDRILAGPTVCEGCMLSDCVCHREEQRKMMIYENQVTAEENLRAGLNTLYSKGIKKKNLIYCEDDSEINLIYQDVVPYAPEQTRAAG